MKRLGHPARVAVFCSALLTILGATLGACGRPLPAGTSVISAKEGSSGAAAASSASSKIFYLKLSHHLVPDAPPARAIEEWTKEVEAATNGRVKFTIYPNQTLATGDEAFSATLSGVCDVAFCNLVYEPERLGLNNVVGLASLRFPTDARGTQIWNELLAKFPQMRKEFTGVKVLGNVVGLTSSIHTKDKVVLTPNDVKGMRIAALGGSLEILRPAGAAVVDLAADDWLKSAEKGVIDGCMAPVGVVTDRGIQTIFKYHLDLGIGQSGELVIINQKVWDSFPADIQAVFERLTPRLDSLLIAADNQLVQEGWAKCAGQTIVKPTAAQLQQWLACCEPAADFWIVSNASKGPSRQIYDYAEQLIEETK